MTRINGQRRRITWEQHAEMKARTGKEIVMPPPKFENSKVLFNLLL